MHGQRSPLPGSLHGLRYAREHPRSSPRQFWSAAILSDSDSRRTLCTSPTIHNPCTCKKEDLPGLLHFSRACVLKEHIVYVLKPCLPEYPSACGQTNRASSLGSAGSKEVRQTPDHYSSAVTDKPSTVEYMSNSLDDSENRCRCGKRVELVSMAKHEIEGHARQ